MPQGLHFSTFILTGAYIQKGVIFKRGLYFSIPPTFANIMIIYSCVSMLFKVNTNNAEALATSCGACVWLGKVSIYKYNKTWLSSVLFMARASVYIQTFQPVDFFCIDSYV